MEFFIIIILLLFISILIGLTFWTIKIIKLFTQKRTKLATINSIVFGLLVFLTLWELRIIPLSKNLDFRNQTKELTGKQFWCWNYYRYEEGGIRGEGYTLDIYKLNNEMALYFNKPDKDFFNSFPNKKFETSNWEKTPILDTGIVNYVTPTDANWSESLEKEIKEKQKIVKDIAKEKGSYFAIRKNNGTDLYLISPKRKMIIYINHNM
jgi:hypothetical protein